jgi:sigma-B regulation protein RsbU (phosphoserine phosphatase)
MEKEIMETQPAAVPAATAPPLHLKALLIEDNPLDARLIQIMLHEAGGGQFELERAERLSNGLEILGNGEIDIVLLDLSLPDSGGGLGTFSTVHARAPHVPIIVMTWLDDERIAVQSVQQGAQDYLVKGQVTGPLLVRAMRYALERKRMAAQLAHYAEELREKNMQMEADFDMAREIQQVFLPQQYPTFPRGAAPAQSALRFFHRYLPAAAVGGDFFNIFAITDSIAAVFICDVMGHGMRAALVTAILRGLVEELLPLAMDPGKFLAEINRSLHAILERTDEPTLATAFYLIADVEEGELRFASAGHPSPLRIRRSAAAAEPLKTYDPRHGPALGLFEKSTYPVCRCPLAVNDLVLLFTDGLYEVQGPNDDEFGEERLLAAVRRRVRLPVEPLFQELLNEVQGFTGRTEFDDDVCLVAMEVARLGPLRESGGNA